MEVSDGEFGYYIKQIIKKGTESKLDPPPNLFPVFLPGLEGHDPDSNCLSSAYPRSTLAWPS
jgi:hypothetical protein